MTPPPSARLARALACLLIPFAIYLMLVAALGDWIMDDAGISYAYARNLAGGHGLVSQPGRPPVEGFSNFLWVVVLAPLFPLGLFHPVFTPKVLSALFVLGSFAILQHVLRRQLGSSTPGLLATVLIAGAPPIVIWTASGLENALTLFLAVALYWRLVERPSGWEIQSGVLTALLAMTHPENMLYLGVGLLVYASGWVLRHDSGAEAARRAARYVGGFAVVFGPFMAFRLAVFGLPFPHPYYAKRVHLSFWSQLAALVQNPGDTATKFLDLLSGIAGPPGPVLVVAVGMAAFYLSRRGTLDRALGVAVALLAIGVSAYLWMDKDWMGEYRFATVTTTFALVSLVIAGFSLQREMFGDRGRHWLTAAYLATIALTYSDHLPRLARFAQTPPTTFTEVAQQRAFKFNAYADILRLRQGSVLLPDIGATLYYSTLTIYDAAGLCEPDVIRTLKAGTIYWRSVHPEFYDYVFETIKPTFINTQAFFTHVTAFERDARFARDYVAINAYRDEYVQRMYGWTAHSGDYVRKDVLRDPSDLQRLREGYRAAPRSDPPIARWRNWALAWAGSRAEARRPS